MVKRFPAFTHDALPPKTYPLRLATQAQAHGIIFAMCRYLFALALLLPSLTLHADEGVITAATWAQPRHGEWLLQQPDLVRVMQALQQQPQARLQLRYPGGDEGALWAEELQAWLVALGLPSSRIERIPGSDSADLIRLSVQP